MPSCKHVTIGSGVIVYNPNGSVDGGQYTYAGDTTISSKYGMRFGITRRFVFNGVTTQGWYPHYRQDGIAQESWINNPSYVKGRDLAGTVLLDNQSGSGPIPIYNQPF